MPIPDYEAIMLPLLRRCADDACRVRDVVDGIADEFDLTDEERERLLPSGRQRVIHNRIHWAKFYLNKAGLIDVPSRGLFIATDAGRAVLAEKPARIDGQFLKGYPAFREFLEQSRTGKPSSSNAATDTDAEPALSPLERLDAADEELRSAVRSDLLERLLSGTPDFFEQVVVDLLVATGYGGTHAEAARRIGGSGDGGIDGVIDEDRLGLGRVYVQAKRYNATPVGGPEVRGFVGSLVTLGATKGVFVTTSTFSTSAREVVDKVGDRSIRLIDGRELAEFMIQFGVGVRVKRNVTVFDLDENSFTEAD